VSLYIKQQHNIFVYELTLMIKVSIIEDHYDFRIGLEKLLDVAYGFECIDAYRSVENALGNLKGEADILLLDINLPKMSGVEALPLLKEKFPTLKIIMLTMLDDDDTILQAIVSGANGYLLKKTKPEKILNSLKECMQGGSPMTGSIASKVLTLFKRYIPQKNNDYALTKREIEILNLLVEGYDNHTIANQLFISFDTVRNHIRHIYQKLHVHSKSQAVVKALRESLV